MQQALAQVGEPEQLLLLETICNVEEEIKTIKILLPLSLLTIDKGHNFHVYRMRFIWQLCVVCQLTT